MESRSADGSALPASSNSWKFIAPLPEHQDATILDKQNLNSYLNVIQGQYTLEAGQIDGYVLDRVQDANGNTLSFINPPPSIPLFNVSYNNQVKQTLCSTCGGASLPSKSNIAASTENNGLFGWLKNLIPSAKAVVVGGDAFCAMNPFDVECSGWSDPGGGGGGSGGGGGGGERRYISFILVYKKVVATGGGEVGTLKFTDNAGATVSTVTKNNPGYIIAASGAPASSATILHIEYWLGSGVHTTATPSMWVDTNASGEINLNKSLDCNYDSVFGSSIDGQKLTQKIFLEYTNDGTHSPTTELLKDCTGTQTVVTGGTLTFVPDTVLDNGAFTISLSGGPASVSPTELRISTSENDNTHYG
ncbi:MAG: hypothetical protein Q7T18_02435, partial [Sedimentisphaerales bacterium]|nr:hypothetical protein [Sedimentisphaerales bacterium]